ncbi:mucin-5AC-like [Lineus longissimus]|uniref:mucin-5AC-like n=1 Tax=Lineus longissimus TaxID=88925 RepID=UPI002B4E446C
MLRMGVFLFTIAALAASNSGDPTTAPREHVAATTSVEKAPISSTKILGSLPSMQLTVTSSLSIVHGSLQSVGLQPTSTLSSIKVLGSLPSVKPKASVSPTEVLHSIPNHSVQPAVRVTSTEQLSVPQVRAVMSSLTLPVNVSIPGPSISPSYPTRTGVISISAHSPSSIVKPTTEVLSTLAPSPIPTDIMPTDVVTWVFGPSTTPNVLPTVAMAILPSSVTRGAPRIVLHSTSVVWVQAPYTATIGVVFSSMPFTPPIVLPDTTMLSTPAPSLTPTVNMPTDVFTWILGPSTKPNVCGQLSTVYSYLPSTGVVSSSALTTTPSKLRTELPANHSKEGGRHTKFYTSHMARTTTESTAPINKKLNFEDVLFHPSDSSWRSLERRVYG